MRRCPETTDHGLKETWIRKERSAQSKYHFIKGCPLPSLGQSEPNDNQLWETLIPLLYFAYILYQNIITAKSIIWSHTSTDAFWFYWRSQTISYGWQWWQVSAVVNPESRAKWCLWGQCKRQAKTNKQTNSFNQTSWTTLKQTDTLLLSCSWVLLWTLTGFWEASQNTEMKGERSISLWYVVTDVYF